MPSKPRQKGGDQTSPERSLLTNKEMGITDKESMRAERRAGEILAEMGERRGGNQSPGERTLITNKELGITKNESSRWQQWAADPLQASTRPVVVVEGPQAAGAAAPHAGCRISSAAAHTDAQPTAAASRGRTTPAAMAAATARAHARSTPSVPLLRPQRNHRRGHSAEQECSSRRAP
jgi:hypothetical protein